MTDHQFDSSIYVIVPVYNEVEVIKQTIQSLSEYPFSVVVVDDGSTDSPFSTLNDLRVHKLRHPINLGQGAALQTGMQYALAQGAQIIVHFDGDGQHRVQDIERMVEPILEKRVDVTLGSRFLRYQDAKEVPFSKRVLLRGAVFVNALLTGLLLTDAHNGLRALSREAALKIHLFENGYSHASEITQQIKKFKLKFEEIPVRIRYTKYSRQKGQSLWNGVNIVIDMILRGILK